jgi:subfamily B ATP-binding cassette protein MsbA
MPQKPLKPIRHLIKRTSFWRDNVLVLNELRFFPQILFFAISLPLLAAVFEGFGIGFLLGFLQNLINPGGSAFKTGLEWFDIWILGINKSDLNRLIRMSGLILASIWIRVFIGYFAAVYMRKAEVSLVNRLYKKIFEQLQALSLSFYSTARSGEILNTLTSEVSQLQTTIRAFGLILTKGSVVVVYAVIAVWISWPLTLISILLFSLVAAGIANLTRRIREASFTITSARRQITSRATEILNGIRTIKAFAAQDFERKQFYQATDDYVAAVETIATRSAIIRPLSEAFASTILIGMVILGIAVFVENGTMQVSALLTFLFLLFRMVPAIQELNSANATITALQGSIHSIKEFLRTDNKPYLQNGYRTFEGLHRAIEIVGVDFGYDPDNPVLRDITLTIEKGTTVALVGASGAGKSTLADLIPRFYDPTGGEILLDGIPLKEFDINSVRRRMAIVSQDTFIFNTSVRENVAYGSENATEAEIIEATKLANAYGFITELPEGLDTVLGDRGVRLSGGQRQRIAIARALLKNPEILILDEATSALDSVSEKLIQASLEKLAAGRTVIAIAHRLSTIANADKVVVMEQGKIIEQGNYQDLLSRKGSLWNYHQMQSSTAQSR